MPQQKIPRTRAARVANAIPRNLDPEDSDDDDDDSEYLRDKHSQADKNDVFEPLFSLFGALAQGCQPNQGFRRSAQPSSLDEDEEQLKRQARLRAMARVGMRQQTNMPDSAPADFVPPCRVSADGHKEWSF